MEESKIVVDVGDLQIIREKSYGFRSNTLQTTWRVIQDGQARGSYPTLKLAKQYAQMFIHTR